MKLINTELQRATIAPFETIEQLNANTKAIRDQYAELLITSEKAVLDVIHRYASKHFGVCYLSKSSIAEMVGLSRRQVIRICQRFESMGVIAQYATDRKRGGGQTSNTIVFLTQISARAAFVNEAVIGDDTADVTPVVTGLDALSETPKEINRLTDDTEKADSAKKEAVKKSLVKDGLVAKLPSTLQNALAPFFNADELYEMTGVVFKAKAAIDKSIMLEDYETEYREAILSVINAHKRGKVRSFGAVLYCAIERTTSAIKHYDRRNQLADMFGL